jgi:hypothetical protein
MGDDFNSSDLEELGADQPNKWAHRGQASIASIIESAVELRTSTKIAVRNASFHGNSPSDEDTRGLWYNRFTRFRQDVLKVDGTSAPSAEQLERFIRGIPTHLKSRNPEKPGVGRSSIIIYLCE